MHGDNASHDGNLYQGPPEQSPAIAFQTFLDFEVVGQHLFQLKTCFSNVYQEVTNTPSNLVDIFFSCEINVLHRLYDIKTDFNGWQVVFLKTEFVDSRFLEFHFHIADVLDAFAWLVENSIVLIVDYKIGLLPILIAMECEKSWRIHLGNVVSHAGFVFVDEGFKAIQFYREEGYYEDY